MPGWTKPTPHSNGRRHSRRGRRELRRRSRRRRREIKEQTDLLPGLALEVDALAEDGGMESLHTTRAAALAAGELELQAAAREACRRSTISSAQSGARAADIGSGDLGDPRAHLTHPHRPVPPDEIHTGLIIEIWSAISAALVLFAVGALVWLGFVPWWAAFVLALASYLVIESAFRRHLSQLLLRIVVILAFVAFALLVANYMTQIVLIGIVGLAVFLLVDNLARGAGSLAAFLLRLGLRCHDLVLTGRSSGRRRSGRGGFSSFVG